jgi:hypothetical protein
VGIWGRVGVGVGRVRGSGERADEDNSSDDEELPRSPHEEAGRFKFSLTDRAGLAYTKHTLKSVNTPSHIGSCRNSPEEVASGGKEMGGRNGEKGRGGKEKE